MQKAIPYKPTTAAAGDSSGGPHSPPAGDGQGGRKPNSTKGNNIQRTVVENPVVVFGRRDCCMSHVVTRLLLGLGVNPTSYEVAEDDEAALVAELSMAIDDPETEAQENNNNSRSSIQFPAVFVGGKLFGGLDRVMATHISGELVPILREAGALWL